MPKSAQPKPRLANLKLLDADRESLQVVWGPLEPCDELVRIQYPAVKLDHAKREIVASRFFEIPAEAINQHGG